MLRKVTALRHYPLSPPGVTDITTVNEATVSLSIIDAKTDRMVAQAWTTEKVSRRNITGSEIERGVNIIFRKLKKNCSAVKFQRL